MKKPNYSVVIVIGGIGQPIGALQALRKLPTEERPREVFVCVGKNPSRQRNLGVKVARTPLVYFLDDDSQVVPGTAPRLLSHFTDPRTAVAGGPNLVPPDAISFEKTVNAVLASWMGSFSVRSRYASIGSVKEATEKDLILCNMMVRREIFLKEGGFRTDLYPNEENEFLNRLLHKGFQLIYDPRGAVYRSRRKSLEAFCYQAFRYGRGRARQMKVYPCLSDLIHLAPAFFVLYLLTLPAAFVPIQPGAPWVTMVRSLFWWVPFGLFVLGAVGTGISAASWHRRFMDAFKVPILIFLRHFCYGLGLFAGFLTPIPRREDSPIQAFKVALKGSKFRFKEIASGKRG